MKSSSATAFAALLAATAILCSGCSGGGGAASAADRSKTACPASWTGGWQRLADRIHAPVYCPSWIPSPLTGDIHGRWSTGVNVDRDHSYLVGFIWVEHSDEVHVNMRGYPGRRAIPKCLNEETAGKKTVRTTVPCFADPKWTKRIDGRQVTLYTVNRDADQWHLLIAWRHHGSLYAVSEHVAPPFGYSRVLANLRHMFHRLVLIRPQA